MIYTDKNQSQALKNNESVANKPMANFVDHRSSTIVQLMQQQTMHSKHLPMLHMNGSHAIVQRELNNSEYTQVKGLALSIMNLYPPDQYHYLGLGKSPTPVMAFLQSVGEQVAIRATNMPLSKFGHRTSSMSGTERQVVDGTELNDEQRVRLWEHFDNFVPDRDTLGGKSILLIDLVQTGKSLVATQRHLEEYLQERYNGSFLYQLLCSCFSGDNAPNVEVLPLMIKEQQVGGTKKTMDSLGLTAKGMDIPGKVDSEESLAYRMGSEKYKPRAEYPNDFKISATNKPKTSEIERDPNGEYAKLLKEIKIFMEKDKELVKFLKGKQVIELVEETESETEFLVK